MSAKGPSSIDYRINCETFSVVTLPDIRVESGLEVIEAEGLAEAESRFLNLLSSVGPTSFKGLIHPNDPDRKDLFFELDGSNPPSISGSRVTDLSVTAFSIRKEAPNYANRLYLEVYETLSRERAAGHAALISVIDQSNTSFNMGAADLITLPKTKSKILHNFAAGRLSKGVGVSAAIIPEGDSILLRRHFEKPGDKGYLHQIRYERGFGQRLSIEPHRPDSGWQPPERPFYDKGGSDREPRNPLIPSISGAEALEQPEEELLEDLIAREM